MSERTTYEIEIRGRASERALRPVADEFSIETTDAGNTRMIGLIRDPSHLNGILSHFTSLNIEVVRITPTTDQR
jgi:hypothetical protein